MMVFMWDNFEFEGDGWIEFTSFILPLKKNVSEDMYINDIWLIF